ncbi:MAG: NRDE family protein [Wenzhouxiangellaceae bacterium]|nr:NRDE family protein [Wenzhouxiangellaceae bacterium]
MCLIAFDWQPGRAQALVLAANRDEFHARPTTPLHWWPDPGDRLAGRDEQAGGTWLAVRRDGRFAAITNFRDPNAPSGARSRGELPLDWLRSPEPARAFARRVHVERGEYGPFNLLIGDPETLMIVGTHAEPEAVAPGVHALSNHLLDTPWPKAIHAVQGLQSWLEATEPEFERLLDLLDDRRPADPDRLPDTGVGTDTERFLSPPFIVGDDYGTRCSTALILGPRMQMAERRFAPDGTCIGERAFGWTRR